MDDTGIEPVILRCLYECVTNDTNHPISINLLHYNLRFDN